MAAKAERREEIFFSLSRSIRYNCPHNINNNKNNTLTFAKEDANTFHAFSHQIHAQRDRSFSISLSAKRERESAFVFPLLELRRDKVNSRETRENHRQIFLERTKKLRRENNELWWPTTASASVVPGAQRVRVSAHIFRSRVSFVSETFSRSREVCVLRFRILVIILSFSSA